MAMIVTVMFMISCNGVVTVIIVVTMIVCNGVMTVVGVVRMRNGILLLHLGQELAPILVVRHVPCIEFRWVVIRKECHRRGRREDDVVCRRIMCLIKD